MHDMAVGEDETVWRENDAGPRSVSSTAVGPLLEPHDAWPDAGDRSRYRFGISVKKPAFVLI